MLEVVIFLSRRHRAMAEADAENHPDKLTAAVGQGRYLSAPRFCFARFQRDMPPEYRRTLDVGEPRCIRVKESTCSPFSNAAFSRYNIAHGIEMLSLISRMMDAELAYTSGKGVAIAR